jgi:hypothetical protein
MKNNTKILIGFLLIIVLSLSQTAITFIMQKDILNEANQIRTIQAPLEVMAQKGFSYQIMLIEEVHGALLHAQEGQWTDVAEHEANYNTLDEQEKKLRHDASVLLAQSTISQETKAKILEKLDIIGEFNPKMIVLEQKGFAAIDNKDLEAANSFLIGGNHTIYKAELFQAYTDWTNLQHQVTLDTSKDIQKDSQRIIYISFIISVIITILIIVTLLVIRSFVAEEYLKRGKRR